MSDPHEERANQDARLNFAWLGFMAGCPIAILPFALGLEATRTTGTIAFAFVCLCVIGAIWLEAKMRHGLKRKGLL